MKKSVKILAALLLSGLVLGFAGCKAETSDDRTDSTPPAKVTIAEDGVTAANSKAVITWTNPADSDFYATRVTVSPALENGNSSLVVEGKAGEKSTVTFEGLTNGTEYTFTLYSLDKSLNASDGATATATPLDTSDKTAPANVTSLTATAKDKSVLLTWTDADDSDIYGYEVSWTSGTASRSVAALEADSMIVAKGLGGVIVRNLTNGTEYTFTVKSVDTSLNKSEGVTAAATPVEVSSKDVLKIDLSVPEAKSNTSVTVTAQITTAGTVKNVVYKKDASIKPAASYLADTTVIDATEDASDNTKWTFTITAEDESANATYTVAAIDSDGREEIEQITISNFDFTAPAKPKVTGGTYSSESSSIVLNWTNPTDSDFDHVELCYTTNDGTSNSEKSTAESTEETSKTYSGIDSDKAYYTFYLVSVDKLGNRSVVASYKVNINSTASSIPEGFVEIPAATIAGTEGWTPSSSVFISGRALKIAGFYMCDHQVTQDEFKSVMGTLPSSMASTVGDAGNNPVNKINWYDAIAYCNKLSAKEGLTPCYTVSGITDWGSFGYSSVPTSSDSTWNAATCDFTANGYRLPTEAEWEWAARGGQSYTYAGSDSIDDVAWYGSNSDSKTHEVKKKTANGYSLYDMSGNVWEWCWDWYGTISTDTAATGPSSGSFRCLRGGSWLINASTCKVANRYYYFPYDRYDGCGFRLVRSAQ